MTKKSKKLIEKPADLTSLFCDACGKSAMLPHKCPIDGTKYVLMKRDRGGI